MTKLHPKVKRCVKVYLFPRRVINYIINTQLSSKTRVYLPYGLDLTTAVVKVRVIKTNNASITDHKPGDVTSPAV